MTAEKINLNITKKADKKSVIYNKMREYDNKEINLLALKTAKMSHSVQLKLEEQHINRITTGTSLKYRLTNH